MNASNNTDIAIVAVAQTPSYRRFNDAEPRMIMDCVNDLLQQTGLDRHDIGFTIAGSCDYLSGMPFAFVQNIDGVGAWPPVYESHVEMDGAWALFEAWIRLQLGDIDLALVAVLRRHPHQGRHGVDRAGVDGVHHGYVGAVDLDQRERERLRERMLF